MPKELHLVQPELILGQFPIHLVFSENAQHNPQMLGILVSMLLSKQGWRQ